MGKRKKSKKVQHNSRGYIPTRQNATSALNTQEKSLELWQHDISLHKIGAALSNTTNGVLSLDFFDTLVARLCNQPTDLFSVVGEHLRERHLLAMDLSPTEFRELRKSAEGKARQNSFWDRGYTEVTLADIYAELVPHVVTDVQKACEIELNIEKELCFINPNVESLVHYATSLGHRVCILSDMYLRSDSIIEIAEHNGFDTSKLCFVATSCEFNNGKTSGFLFKLAMKQLGVGPDKIFHLGDNLDADVQGALKADVKGYHYYRSTEESDYVFAAESRLCENDTTALGMNSVRTLVERTDNPNHNPFLQAGRFTIGPILSNWADWCVWELKKRGIKQVFALMREGRILAQMLKNSAIAMGVDLSVTELFVSRQSTHLGSVCEATTKAIAERVYSRTVGEIFDSFGLYAKEYGFPDHIVKQEITSTEMLHTIVRAISSGKIKEVVEQKSAKARAEFIAYFKPLLNEKHVAMIDLGWAGTIQRNIAKMLEFENIEVTCEGFYVATSLAASHVFTQGTTIHGYLSNFNNHAAFSKLLFRSPEIIEQTVSAPIGSTIGYAIDAQGAATPILEENHATHSEQLKRGTVQKGILDYQTAWLNIATRKKIFSPNTPFSSFYKNNIQHIKNGTRALTHRLIAYPTQNEATSLGCLHHDDGLYSKAVTMISHPAKQAILENDGYQKMMRSPKTYWPQGVLAQSNQTIVKQIATGIENVKFHDALGKRLSIGDYTERHPVLSSSYIAHIAIHTDDWVYYFIDINCPNCTTVFEERLKGTFSIDKLIGCPHCGAIYRLNYHEIQKYFTLHKNMLLGDDILEIESKMGTIRDDIGFSTSTTKDIPLLATLANTFTVSSISKLICTALTQDEDFK